MNESEERLENLWNALQCYDEAARAPIGRKRNVPIIPSHDVRDVISSITAEGDSSRFAKILPSLRELEKEIVASEEMKKQFGAAFVPVEAYLQAYEVASHLLRNGVKG